MNENKNKGKIKINKTFTATLLFFASIILMLGCTNLEKMPPTGKPFISITADKTNGEAPLNVSFTVTAIPARGSIKKLVIDYGDGSSEDLTQKLKGDTVSVSHEFKAIGVFTVRVAAMDENDNSQSEVQIITNDRPIISNLKAYSDSEYTKEATVFMPNTYVYIKATCIDADGIRATIIDWGDGTVETSFSGCSGNHTYSKEGEYTINVMVQDYAPQPLTNVASITVKVRYGIPPINNPPRVDIMLLNASGEAPLTVTLYVGAIDVDGQVAEVKVDWGDGNYETLTDKIEEPDSRKLYKKEHTYTSQGEFTLTVIAKDDKGEVSMKTGTVKVSSSKPILSVKFKDHTNADPNGKTYNIDMTAPPYTAQATISADIFAYDITNYNIVEVIRVDYADGSTSISISSYPGIYLIVGPDINILPISPSLIRRSPKSSYSSGITANVTVTIYAVKSGVGGELDCQSHPSNDLSNCENIINRIKNHPSATSIETKFTVKPK
jgi:PKD repeat protein